MKNIVMILIIVSQFLTTSVPTDIDDPLFMLFQAQEEFNLELTYWEVIIKEKIMSEQTFNKISNEWSNYKTHQLRNGHQQGIEIQEISEKRNQVTINQQLISPHEESPYAERQIVISGTSFNQNIQKEYKRIISQIMTEIDTKSTRTYTCLKFQDDGIIDGGFVLSKITSNLGVLHNLQQEEILEKSFIKKEYYGYSPVLKQHYLMGGQPFNLQIVVIEKTNNQLEYVLGTPILITEY